jgi:hypothetical protein
MHILHNSNTHGRRAVVISLGRAEIEAALAEVAKRLAGDAELELFKVSIDGLNDFSLSATVLLVEGES